MKPWDQRLAAIVVRPFANSFVTPNMMTGIGLAFGLGAALLFSLGEWSWAGVLFVLAVFWDHTDGELARLTGQTSRFGHYFDHTVAFLNYASSGWTALRSKPTAASASAHSGTAESRYSSRTAHTNTCRFPIRSRRTSASAAPTCATPG